MKRSDSRILTTHTGSLPRSPDLQELLRGREDGTRFDRDSFDSGVRRAVAEVVTRQRNAGIDVVNDGEQGRAQYATYVKERLSGFEGERLVRARPRLDDARLPGVCRHANPPVLAQHASTSLHRTHLLERLAGGGAGYRTSEECFGGRSRGRGVHDGRLARCNRQLPS